jgi:hypothetical protein
LKCGQDEHVVNFSCKGKGCPYCGKILISRFLFTYYPFKSNNK